jgi:multidrug efflux pump subunit AcrA (membrane-fusion protein)
MQSQDQAYPSWYVHQDLNRKSTCDRIVQWTRTATHSDRVWLLVPKGARWTVVSVSGVAKLHRHSAEIRTVQDAAKILLRGNETVEYPSEIARSPQEERAIDQLLDATQACRFKLVSLSMPNENLARPVAALLLEHFGATDSKTAQLPWDDGTLRPLKASCAVSLHNANRWSTLPGLSIAQFLGWLASPIRRWKTLIACLSLVSAIAALGLIRTDYEVEVSGFLRPAVSRNYFAPSDGVVSDILVRHGDQVDVGSLLLRVESNSLEQMLKQLEGELLTTQQQLLTIQAQRIATQSSRESKPNTYDPQLTESLQLESKVKNLEAQMELTRRESSKLAVRSETTGRVATWDLESRLKGRPVSRGELLLTIEGALLVSASENANATESSWRLELEIPQRYLADIIRHRETNRSLMVRFAVGTEPESRWDAKLLELSTATQLNGESELIIKGLGPVVSELDPAIAQSGATVRAKVKCGQSSLAYAWFHDLVYFWHRYVLFPFR